METMERSRFDRAPVVDTDEDGETAYVAVTATTATFTAAVAWLAENASELGWSSEFTRLVPERVKCHGLHCEIDQRLMVVEVPSDVALRAHVRDGLVKAWWALGVYDAREELPADFDEVVERRRAEHIAEQKRKADEWGAPWWWHLRVWLSDLLSSWGSDLNPKDRTSTSWQEDGSITIVENLRRPKSEDEF